MGWSESHQGCKRHPNEKQLPGVCSSCLREKLSQLNASSNKTTFGGVFSSSSSLSLSPAYSSVAASSTSYVSPVYRRHRRKVSERLGSISFTVSVGHGLKKSRSMAFAVTRSTGLADEVAGGGGGGKKKGGFWSKLIRSATGKKNKDVLLRTRTESQRLQ